MDREMDSPSGSNHNEEDDYDGDSIAIIQFSGGDEFSADLVMIFNDEQISVTVFAPCQSSGTSSIEKHLVDLINQASFGEADEYNSLSNAILDILQPAGEDEFRRVAPKAPAPPPSSSSLRMTGEASDANTNLHSLLYPKTHYFAFRREAPDAQPKIVPMSASEVHDRIGELPYDSDHLDEEGAADGSDNEIRSLLSRHRHLPRYTTKDIDVLEEILHGGAVTRVRVVSRNGDDADNHISSNDLLCKATSSSSIMMWPTLRRELECLLTLHEHDYQASSSLRMGPAAPRVSRRSTRPRPCLGRRQNEQSHRRWG
ncbi:hypothetical protein SPI_04852 [Niveomyces insectorum RCEF 264]|uniref:Uncharacterized protein n=1 Tax=Niveomyces insectorum RCEF 264 TaxID=1081102 RepID=A0A167UX04_9HYPO|nr:hypothetical protein SPI_04852 [Niveomyces insectorum RCEF 264]